MLLVCLCTCVCMCVYMRGVTRDDDTQGTFLKWRIFCKLFFKFMADYFLYCTETDYSLYQLQNNKSKSLSLFKYGTYIVAIIFL